MKKVKIIGFYLKSIEAKRFSKSLPNSINIRSTPSIDSISREKDSVGKVVFSFVTEYSPGIATIRYEGEILLEFENSKKMEETIRMWNEKRKLKEDIDILVRNFLFKKCLTLGILIADEMKLPPPLMFPQIVKRGILTKKTKVNLSYIG